MKHLAKLFLAVAAGVFALSCVTDATEDLGVKLNGGQVTEITISLEDSRTQLGEKADGVYPLYWSEGDVISVNGTTSAEAVISDSNPASATFTVQGDVAAPYCIAYPAAPAGQVVFAETQVHAGGSTFSAGASTMYGYSNASGVQLNHLTGVLKFGITGSTILTKVQISTIDRAPIAGAFNIDFATGKLTATEDSKYVINYEFPATADAEGLELSSEPQYLHIAVPAGTYKSLFVTLYDKEGGVMYATIKAGDEKPLAVGKVREFGGSIAYAPINNQVHIIKDVESLKAFASAASSSKKDVVFVADVDLTGESWKSIAATNYAGTVYGNGYSIKGLTAPLFGQTKASFEGIHLVDLNITTTDRMVGGLVTYINNANGYIRHCSATGKINVNLAHTTSFASIGGIIGTANLSTVPFYDLYADVDITVITAKYSSNLRVGGIGAYTKGSVSNSVNMGSIYVDANVEGEKPLVVGGIFACVGSTCENLRNGSEDSTDPTDGAITITDNTKVGGNTVIGGCFANWEASDATITSGDNCHNYGIIRYDGATTGNLQVGGISGTSRGYSNSYNGSAKDTTHEKGALYINGSTSAVANIGGITGNTSLKFDNVHNYANISVGVTATSYITIGGIIGVPINGRGGTPVTNATNSGKLTFSGNCQSAAYMGGIVSNRQDEGLAVTIKDSYNYGDIEATETATLKTQMRIGGILAYTASLGSVLENCHNSGNLSFKGKAKGQPSVGGVLGMLGGGNTPCTLKNLSNCGDLTSAGALEEHARIGGVIAVFNGAITDESEGAFLNTGKVTFSAISSHTTANFAVGGVIGASAKDILAPNCRFINKGDIVVTVDPVDGQIVNIGGVIGSNTAQFINGEAYCSIKAIGYSNVGMVMGSSRVETVAEDGATTYSRVTNCKLGGTIIRALQGTENGDGETVYSPVTETIDESNFQDYIYGGNTIWAEGSDYDGCSFLSVEPTI